MFYVASAAVRTVIREMAIQFQRYVVISGTVLLMFYVAGAAVRTVIRVRTFNTRDM